jgi:transposase
MTDDNTCPRCGHGIPSDERRGEYPGALSRLDNETWICSQCGTDEAMYNWAYPGLGLPPLNQRALS